MGAGIQGIEKTKHNFFLIVWNLTSHAGTLFIFPNSTLLRRRSRGSSPVTCHSVLEANPLYRCGCVHAGCRDLSRGQIATRGRLCNHRDQVITFPFTLYPLPFPPHPFSPLASLPGLCTSPFFASCLDPPRPHAFVWVTAFCFTFHHFSSAADRTDRAYAISGYGGPSRYGTRSKTQKRKLGSPSCARLPLCFGVSAFCFPKFLFLDFVRVENTCGKTQDAAES